MSRDEPWTVRRLLEWTAPFFARKGVDAPRMSAELLLAHVLAIPRIRLYTDYERVLPDDVLARFRELVKRAGEHEPIAYLTGRAHFFELEFEVTRDTLIPRPETETLVEAALNIIKVQPGLEAPRVLDLCTGTGCVAAAIARRAKAATVVATDVSEAAVAVARRNVERLGLADRVTVHQGDLYDALASAVDAGPFHVITANPPYIRSGDVERLDRNVREYEPLSALDGGPDGLALHRRILAGAAGRLAAGGRVLLEIAFDQGPAALDVAAHFPEFDDAKVLKDLAGRDRVLAVRKVS